MEGIQFENGILLTYIQRYYPDIRKTIKEIQANCNNNTLLSDDIV